ncbi:MAG: hypothetical protein Q9217_002178 [Psora testacea]
MASDQSPPSRPGPSPLKDHKAPGSPRVISFAASASSPVTRPTTSSSRTANDISDKEGPRRGSAGAATAAVLWTDAQEERLIFVQSELKKAQKRWSSSQDIWLEEEHHLLELKRLHKKSLKKNQAAVKKAAGIWKSKTWGNRIGSLRSSRKNSTMNINDGSEDHEAASNHDDNSGPEDTDSDESEKALERTSTHPSFPGAIRRLSFTVLSRRSTGTPDNASRAWSRSGSPRR